MLNFVDAERRELVHVRFWTFSQNRDMTDYGRIFRDQVGERVGEKKKRKKEVEEAEKRRGLMEM